MVFSFLFASKKLIVVLLEELSLEHLIRIIAVLYVKRVDAVSFRRVEVTELWDCPPEYGRIVQRGFKFMIELK